MSGPIDRNVYLAVRQLFTQGLNQEVVEFSKRLPTPWPAGVTFCVVAALINLDQNMLARQHLDSAISRVNDDEKADLTALEGLLHSYRGDAEGYQRKAVEASNLRATAHTLYHLGLALLDPQERLRALQASLIAAEEAGDVYAEARNASALASAHMEAGRYKEALGWLQFSHDRTSHPVLVLITTNLQAYLQILIGDLQGLENKLIEVDQAVDDLSYSRQRTELRSTLADLYQATERYENALHIYQHEFSQAPRAIRAWLIHGCVRALCALNRQEEARRQAEVTVSITDTLSEHLRQRARLAMGISLWPLKEALPYLVDAHRFFHRRNSILATEAAFHLVALNPSEVAASVKATIDDAKTFLALTGMRLLAGRAFASLQKTSKEVRSLRLFALGKAELYLEGTPVTIRGRSIELLTLLVSRPSGYEAEALSEALYGNFQSASLRVELHRLRREVGVEVGSRPYRLTSPVWSDLVELEDCLNQGKLYDAIKLYRGPLLPQSVAPEIVELRGSLEAELHAAVLDSGNLDVIWELAQIMPFDLELWEVLMQRLSKKDPRHSVAVGRSARVRSELEI